MHGAPDWLYWLIDAVDVVTDPLLLFVAATLAIVAWASALRVSR